MATTQQVGEYRQANQTLVRLAQSDLRSLLGSLDLSGDPYAVKAELLEFFPDLVATYGSTSAVLGADFYDMLRDVPPSAASFRAASAAPASRSQAEGSVRWAIGSLFETDPDPTRLGSSLAAATQRLVWQPFRETVFDSAHSDPVRTGVARVPTGLKTCAFCTMLASRGPVYKSEINAELVVGRGSNRTGYDANGKRLSGGVGGGVRARGTQTLAKKFHDDCDCMTVVIRSQADYPDGYDVDEYRRLYAAGEGVSPS